MKEQLNSYITHDSFIIEKPAEEALLKRYERFAKDKYEGLFYLGLEESQEGLSPGLNFLHELSAFYLKSLTRLPELELAREHIEHSLSEEDANELMETMPYILGMEHVNNSWITLQCNQILRVFKFLIKESDKSVEDFFHAISENIHVADKVYFHLVEQKEGEYPFAFMATYSVKRKIRPNICL